MHEQTPRPFIVFSFSTAFPCLLVNQSFIPEVGSTIALTNMHSDLRFNPSSGLCINLVIVYYVDPLLYIVGCNIVFVSMLLCIAQFPLCFLLSANHAAASS